MLLSEKTCIRLYMLSSACQEEDKRETAGSLLENLHPRESGVGKERSKNTTAVIGLPRQPETIFNREVETMTKEGGEM